MAILFFGDFTVSREKRPPRKIFMSGGFLYALSYGYIGNSTKPQKILRNPRIFYILGFKKLLVPLRTVCRYRLYYTEDIQQILYRRVQKFNLETKARRKNQRDARKLAAMQMLSLIQQDLECSKYFQFFTSFRLYFLCAIQTIFLPTQKLKQSTMNMFQMTQILANEMICLRCVGPTLNILAYITVNCILGRCLLSD